MDYIVLIRKLHFLDRAKKIIDNRDLKSEKGIEYTNSIIEEAMKQQNIRLFNIQNDSSVINHLNSILTEKSNQKIQIICDILAQRLLDKESLKQSKVEKISELQKGGLFQALIKLENEPTKLFYVFAKIDFSSVRDEVNYDLLSKLPDKHKVFKSCIFTFNNLSIDTVSIHDSSPQIATYWWQDYFELLPIIDDESNTDNVLKETRRIININTKNKQSDRKALFNLAANYMEQKETFVLDEFIDSIFKGYIPRSQGLKVEDIKEKLTNELKNSVKRIDRQFTIHKETVKRVIIEKNILVNDNIEITMKGCIDNRPDLIKSLSEGGNKYLRIKIANEYHELYDRFRSDNGDIE